MWFVWVVCAGAAAPETWSPQPPVEVGSRILSSFTVAPLSGRRASDTASARADMVHQARTLGWPVLGLEDRGPDRTVEARLVLGGELRETDRIRLQGRTGHAVEVWWQLTDRRHDKVLYEVSTIGWAPASDGLTASMGAAFDQVLARDGFVVALESAGRASFFERAEPIRVRDCTEPHATTPRRATVGVRQEHRSGTGVVVSPDGWVWAPAHVLTDPSAPILVHTASGRLPARWLAADAHADVVLLELPTTDPTACAVRAPQIPHVREALLAFTPHRRRVDLSIQGFRLQERPPRIVVGAPAPAVASPVYDGVDYLVGMRTELHGELVVRPHQAVSDALGLQWTAGRSRVPEPTEQHVIVDRPDPGFSAPPRR